MIFRRTNNASDALLTSRLFSERTFYPALMNDIGACNKELIIESPFITKRRVALLLPKLRKLTARGVKITVNTRDPQEHEEFMQHEAEEGTALLQSIGVNVLFTGGHHRKLVILDRRVFYEGSLNVLSQWDSCEFMRRIESEALATQTLNFIGIKKFL